MFRKIGAIMTLGALFLMGSSVRAQQITYMNNSIVNYFSLNPSYAGNDGSELFFHHRNGLIGIEGAPQTSQFTAAFRLGKTNSGIGFKLSHEQSNILSNYGAYMSYAYHLKMADKHHLSFGVSVGIKHNGISANRVNVLEEGDEIIFAYDQSVASFDADFGLNYRVAGLEVQGAVHNLLGNRVNYENTFEQLSYNYQFVRHLIASAGYTFRRDKKFTIKPILQVRGAQGLNVVPEGILRFGYNDKMWIAGHYRLNSTWAVSTGLNFAERFTVGYSGEFSANQLAGWSAGTHELVFGFKLNDLKNLKKNANTEEKNTSTLERINQEKMDFLARENEQLRSEQEQLRKEMNQIKQESKGVSYEEVKKMMEKFNKEQKPEEKDELNEEDEQGIIQKAKSIQFEPGKEVLKSESYESLNYIVDVLNKKPSANIIIEGHTDSSGNAEANIALSKKRAEQIKTFFMEKGISSDRMRTEGYGSSRPISSNDTEEGRKANRRVEIVFE